MHKAQALLLFFLLIIIYPSSYTDSSVRDLSPTARDNDYQSSVYLSTARHILASSGERIRQKGTGRLDNTENLGRVESKQFPSSAKQERVEGQHLLHLTQETTGNLDLDEAEEEDLDKELLSTWWPQSSQWQQPVNPFVERRDTRPGTSRSRKVRPSLPGIGSLFSRFQTEFSIPRIFHQVYLKGEEALEAAEIAEEHSAEPWLPVKGSWRQACKDLHPSWEFKLWDLSGMELFLETHYPWFLPIFNAYPSEIHKVDAVRPFIMHAYGGVYIDLDTECLQPVEPFLEEHDLVFQLEDFGTKSLVNSAIAGAPKLYFWELWQQVIAGRADQVQRKKTIFSGRDHEVNAVLNATGPWALRAAFQSFSRDQGLLSTSYVGAWRINGSNVMVYPLGTWFVPCLWNNAECHNLVEQMILTHSFPKWLAGHHKNAGSWFKSIGYARAQPWWQNVLFRFCFVASLLCSLWAWMRRQLRRQRQSPQSAASSNAKLA